MSILKFAASLLPRIGRDRIEEDIGLLITELNTVTIPALKLAQDSLGKGLKSKEGQAIEKQYRAYSRNPEKGSMIDSIRVRIEASTKLLEKNHWMGRGHSKERSKTFPGIAKAMAEQWGEFE